MDVYQLMTTVCFALAMFKAGYELGKKITANTPLKAVKYTCEG